MEIDFIGMVDFSMKWILPLFGTWFNYENVAFHFLSVLMIFFFAEVFYRTFLYIAKINFVFFSCQCFFSIESYKCLSFLIEIQSKYRKVGMSGKTNFHFLKWNIYSIDVNLIFNSFSLTFIYGAYEMSFPCWTLFTFAIFYNEHLKFNKKYVGVKIERNQHILEKMRGMIFQ